MDTGRINGIQHQALYKGAAPSTEAPPVAAEPRDSFMISSDAPDAAPDAASLKALTTAQMVLEKSVKQAFELTEKWSVPIRGSIYPDPTVGPHGEINASCFGDFTVVKDGSKVIEAKMEDPKARFEGNRTLAVSRPPAFSDDGKAYIPDRSGTLHAYDLTTGEKIWEFKADRTLRERFGGDKEGLTSPVLGKGDRLFIRDGHGGLYALDRNKGSEVWSNHRGALSFSPEHDCVPPPENHPPALSSDGTLYVTGKNGTLYAIDGETGKYRKGFQPFDAGKSIFYSFSPVCDKEGRVYVPSRGETDAQWTFTCLDGATGRELWNVKAGDNLSAPVFGPDGTVYLGTQGETWIRKDNPGENQKVIALDPHEGKVKWEAAINGRIEQVEIDGEGKRLAVLEKNTKFLDEWEDIESINNIILIDSVTGSQKADTAPIMTEMESIRSIAFLPGGELMIYAGGALKACTISDQNLFIDKDGRKVTTGDMKADPSAGKGDDDAGIFIDGRIISIDGVRMVSRNGSFHKL